MTTEAGHIRSMAITATAYANIAAARAACNASPETNSIMDNMVGPYAGEGTGTTMAGFIQLRSDHKTNIYFLSAGTIWMIELIYGYA